jgi:hypothetical protein
MLTASASGATSYLWSNGETTSSITVSPTSTTVYSVSINGSCGVLNGQITVNVSPLLNFTATVSSSNIWNNVGSVQTVNLNAFPISGAVILSEGFNNSQCVGSNTTGTISPVCGNGLSSTWSLPSGNWVAAVNTTAIDYGTCTDPPPILTTTTSDGFMYGGTISPWEGSHLVSFNSSRTKGGNFATLTSPSFSTIGYTGVMVDFYMLMLVTNALNGERIELSYSTDGTTFTNFSPNYARKPWNCNAWEQFSCQLPNAAANQPNVWIRFRFISGQNCDSGGSAGNNLDIDMVRITGTTAPGGYGFYSYQWQEYNTPVLGIVNPNAQSTTTVNYTGTATGSKYWTCTITDAYGCVSTATTGFVNLNVQSNATTGAGTTAANPTLVCPGGSSNLTFTQTGAGNIQWQSSTTSATTGFSDISGANTANYTANNINQTTWFRVRLTGMAYSNGLCSPPSFTSAAVMVEVASFNSGIIQNTGETVSCAGDPGQFGFTTLPSGSGTYSVQWYAFDGSTTAPTGSIVPSGWNAVGGPVSPTVTVMPTQTFSGAGLPAGWAFGTTPATITTTCGGAANNAINFNTNTSPWGQSVTSQVYAAPVTSLSFVHGASGCCSRTSTLTVEAWNGSSWTLVTGGTVSQSSTAAGGCNSSVKSFSFSPALNYTQFRVTRTAGTATKVTVDDWNVTTQTNISYDPPAPATATTTYAAYVTFTGGACPYSGWATNAWIVNFLGSGTSTDWTGAIDTDWFKPGNWSCGIPVCGVDAVIPSAPVNQPQINDLNGTGAICRTITINSGATLTTIGSANLDVCGNWVKDGTYTYNSGKISMVGTTAQTMSPASTFHNLTINNTGAGVTISADQTVNNILTLIDGVVTTDANHVIISNESPGNVVNGGANPTNYTNSWINGNIRRAFTTNTGIYDFPVGCGTYAALARLTNGNIGGVTSIDAWYKEPLTSYSPLDATKAIDFGTPYDACYSDGYWYLEPETSSISSGNYVLQLYFNGFTSITAADDNKFGIVKRPSTSVSSMDWSTQIPTDGAGFLAPNGGAGRLFSDGFAQRSNLTMFSHFAIAYAANPLPIELTSFTGSCAGRTKTFNWTTASETNNDYFSLERSTDGETFETVKIIPGAGTSTSSQHYSVQIAEADANLVYYRLKQTDYDGQFSYSNIIHVSCTSDNGYADELTVYPNPANESIQIQLHSNEQGTYVIAIYNLLGPSRSGSSANEIRS